MDDTAALADWLRLTLIPGIGGETQRKLLSAFGLPQSVFSAGSTALRGIVGEKATRLLLDTDNRAEIDTALAWATSPGCHILTLADRSYPQSLLEIPDPPTLIYVRGRLELLNARILAVVGSRNPTPQGTHNAEQFSSAFAQTGLVVASGLALGVDAAAHRGALGINGNTIAFIGTGIDRIYPARNRELALEIGERGAIVSEFPLGTPVNAANFPRRNRLISGISSGVLVVEASVQSGSLITARLAGEQGREVFAIPGSIHSPQSRGCHKLIKQGAKLVETAEDVLEELGFDLRLALQPSTEIPPAQSGQVVDCAATDDVSHRLLSALSFDPCGLDELVARTGLSAEVLSVTLLHLELERRVSSLPGGRYQRLPDCP